MNIQIFGKSKCFDTKKAERYFKERRIKYQYVDIVKYGISLGELKAVSRAVGFDNLINDSEDAAILRYLSSEEARLEKLFDNQQWLVTPLVRNGKKATVGYKPEVWSEWD